MNRFTICRLQLVSVGVHWQWLEIGYPELTMQPSNI